MRVFRTTFSVGTRSAIIDRKSNSISSSARNISLALACGSQSASSVGCPDLARQAARFTAVVDLPTPPLKLAIVMTSAVTVLLTASRAGTGIIGVSRHMVAEPHRGGVSA